MEEQNLPSQREEKERLRELERTVSALRDEIKHLREIVFAERLPSHRDLPLSHDEKEDVLSSSSDPRASLVPFSQNYIFVSYSHEDTWIFERFRDAFAPHRNQTNFHIWPDDRHILAGTLWKEKHQQALANTKVAILLVSIDFFASDFIQNDEIPSLIEAAEQKKLIIVVIVVGPCSYHTTNIANYHVINDPTRPLRTLNKPQREKHLVSAWEYIMKVIQQLSHEDEKY